MSVSDAYVRIECDYPGCREEQEVELCALARSGEWDERDVEAKLKRDGWKVDGDEHFCSWHEDDDLELEEEEEDEKAS